VSFGIGSVWAIGLTTFITSPRVLVTSVRASVGGPVSTLLPKRRAAVDLLVVDGDDDLVVAASKDRVREERLVVDPLLRRSAFGNRKPEAEAGSTNANFFTAQLLDAVDSRVGADDDLRAIRLAPLAQRRQDDLRAVLVVRQHVGERRKPARRPDLEPIAR